MAYFLDYSAAKLDGSVIRAAGYTGVIRYIDAPNLLGTKHTDLTEYRSHLAAGLTVRLVHQGTKFDADSGFQGGVNRATRAKAGADYLGYSGVIFFTNDRPELPNAAKWQAYLDGAASVLGVTRVGAYGFFNALNAAVGHASAFWQAGRKSDLVPQANFLQDNNVQVTVGGITCDRNQVIADYTPTGAAPVTVTPEEEDDMQPLKPGVNVHATYVIPEGKTKLYLGISGYGDTATLHQVDYWGVTDNAKDPKGTGNGVGGGFVNLGLGPNRPGPCGSDIPAAARIVTLRYTSNCEVAIGFRKD